jgi:hypothetical protein
MFFEGSYIIFEGKYCPGHPIGKLRVQNQPAKINADLPTVYYSAFEWI